VIRLGNLLASNGILSLNEQDNFSQFYIQNTTRS